MKEINNYVLQVVRLLEIPRNELHKKKQKVNDKKIDELIHQYDLSLLEKYRYIEKLLNEELESHSK